MENKKHIWEPDKEIREECNKILTTVQKFLRYYFYMIAVTLAMDLIQPAFTKSFPTKMFIPEGWFNYLWLAMVVNMPTAAAAFALPDALFCSIAAHLLIQFKILSHRFKNIMIANSRGNWKQLVDQHNFLLKYCKDVNRLYNFVFLMQYFMANTAALGVFISLRTNISFLDVWSWFFYLFVTMLETGIYCFSTDLISEEMYQISFALYDSHWEEYNIHPTNRADIIFVMTRSQKKILFSGGSGLVWINVATFTQIFKATLSFYTLLNRIA